MLCFSIFVGMLISRWDLLGSGSMIYYGSLGLENVPTLCWEDPTKYLLFILSGLLLFFCFCWDVGTLGLKMTLR